MLSLHTNLKHKLAAVLTAVVGLSTVALAAHGIMVINGVFAYTMPAGFTDQVFYDAIVEEFKTEFPNEAIPDTGLTNEQLAKITFLKHSGVGGDTISDTSGLEKLVGLETLDLQWNNIATVDLSANVNLQEVNFEKNALTAIDLSSLVNLTKLTVANNQLTSLDLSQNANLKTLYAGSNSLTSLDLSNNPVIESVYAGYNGLSSIGVANNTTLTTLNVSNNSITEIDVSNDTALKTLKIDFNQISSLNLTNATALDRIEALSNQIGELDLSTNLNLTYLDIDINPISSIDLTNNAKLKLFRAVSDNFVSLDFSHNPDLETLYVPHNQLTSIDVSTNTKLKNFEVYENQITSLDLTNNTLLKTVIAYDNALTSLVLPNNTTLTQIDVHKNNLTSLDVSQYTLLTKLVAYNNSLTSLDVSNNTKLTTLEINNNSISEMDIRNNTTLTSFKADNIPVMMDIELSLDGGVTKFDLSNLKFLKANQTINDTEDYDYTSTTKTLAILDGYVGLAQITSSTSGLRYQVVLPMYLAYDANGGTGAPGVEICYPATSSSKCNVQINGTEPTWDGHYFLGWSTDANANTASYTSGWLELEDYVTLYAIWAPDYILSYDANGGEGTYEAQKCHSTTSKVGTCKINIAAENPTRENHVFLGWSLDVDAETGSYWDGSEIEMSGSVALKAMWGIKYTLNYNTDGGEGSFASQSCEADNTKATTCEITISDTSPTKGDYKHFLGWSTDNSAKVANYQPGNEIEMDGNKTLYARWTVHYYLTYGMNFAYESFGAEDCYGNSTDSTTCDVFLTDGVPTRNKKTFLGWASDENADTGEYAAGAKVTLNSDTTTIYAIWGIKYQLNYSLNGGTGTFGTQTCEGTTAAAESCEVKLSTAIPVKDDSSFYGWANSASDTVAAYQPGMELSLNDDKMVYAVWGNEEIDWDEEDFKKGESDGITIRVVYDLSTLEKVLIDGNEVSSNQYVIDLDDNTITLKATYLDTLPAGEHAVQLVFTGGVTVNLNINIVTGQEGGGEGGSEDSEGKAEMETSEDGDLVLDLTTPKVKTASVTVNIYDEGGNLVKTVEISDPGSTVRVDVSDLPNGNYTAELIHKDEEGNVILTVTQDFIKTEGMEYVTLSVQAEVDVTKQIKIEIYDENGELVRTIIVDTETGTVYVYDADGNLIDTVPNGYVDGKLKIPMDGLESGEYDIKVTFLDGNGREVKVLTIDDVEYVAQEEEEEEEEELAVPNTGEMGNSGISGVEATTIAGVAVVVAGLVIVVRMMKQKKDCKESMLD